MDTQTPSWLAPSQHEAQLGQVPLPTETSLPAPIDTRTHLDLTYEAMFETTVDLLAGGRPLSHIVRDDPRPIEYAHYLAWIHKDPERRKRYYAAKEIGAEALEDELMVIADGADSMEDIARSNLRINTRKFLMQVWNKRRFGETKQLEVNTTVTVNMREELANRDKQLASIFEGEFVRE